MQVVIIDARQTHKSCLSNETLPDVVETGYNITLFHVNRREHIVSGYIAHFHSGASGALVTYRNTPAVNINTPLIIISPNIYMYMVAMAHGVFNKIRGNVCNDPDKKVHGANMGPAWVLSAPDGPHEPCYQGSWPFSCKLRISLTDIAVLLYIIALFWHIA